MGTQGHSVRFRRYWACVKVRSHVSIKSLVKNHNEVRHHGTFVAVPASPYLTFLKNILQCVVLMGWALCPHADRSLFDWCSASAAHSPLPVIWLVQSRVRHCCCRNTWQSCWVWTKIWLPPSSIASWTNWTGPSLSSSAWSKRWSMGWNTVGQLGLLAGQIRQFKLVSGQSGPLIS